jgi:DNA-binding IclR family transcriptional regulator
MDARPGIVAENCTAVHPASKVAAMDAHELSAHVLQALAQAQSEGRASSLDTLVDTLRVRRGDVRRTITLLHRQGYVDAMRMRLTLPGFALGRAYMGTKLPALRRPKLAQVSAA